MGNLSWVMGATMEIEGFLAVWGAGFLPVVGAATTLLAATGGKTPTSDDPKR